MSASLLRLFGLLFNSDWVSGRALASDTALRLFASDKLGLFCLKNGRDAKDDCLGCWPSRNKQLVW